MVLFRGDNREDKMTDRAGVTEAPVEVGHAGPDGAHASPRPADPEVKATRRRFSAEYKLRILREADACAPGEVAALLRREGLYYSRLKLWRQQRERGELDALGRRRGPVPSPETRIVEENEKLRGEVTRLRERLERAEAVITVQKKLSQLLGIALPQDERAGGDL